MSDRLAGRPGPQAAVPPEGVRAQVGEEGRVLQGRYETSAYLADLGIVGGDDITVEAAITKLMFVLGLGLEPAPARRLLAQDLRGEITPL